MLNFETFRRIGISGVRKAVLLAAALFALQAYGQDRNQEQEEDNFITVVSWGGSYARSSVQAYHGRFEEETGIEVRLEEYSGGLAQVRAQVETGRVVWDVVDMEAGDVTLGCDEGLLEENDYDSLPPAPDGTLASQDFIAGYDTECGVKGLIYSTIYAYNEEAFPGEKPVSIADFFDIRKFPGRRGMRRTPNANLEFALVADGVPPDQVYKTLSSPGGVERALAKINSIKKHIVWWQAGAQPPQMLADGEVVMSTAYNGRIFNAVALEKQPFAVVWDGQVLAAGYQVVLAGSKKPDLARQFVAFATSTQAMADLTKYISYSPMRRSAAALVDRHLASGLRMAPHMPNSPQNTVRAVHENASWWADNQDDMNERFLAWLSR